MVVRELITKFGFKVDDKPLKRMESDLKTIKKNVTLITGAAVAAAGSLFGIAKSVANIGDEAAKTAKSVGLTAESLQALQFAASISGVEHEAMNKSLQKFSRTVLEARRGTETYARSFRELGISSDVLNDKNADTETLLKAAADRFAKMPDGIQKTGLAIEMFGRTGAKLIPLLNEGSAGIEKLTEEARKLGFVMGEEDTKNAEEFNDALTRLSAVGRGLKIMIGKDLLPVIQDLVDQFREFVLANRDLIKTKIDAFIKGLIKFVKTFVTWMTKVWNVMDGIVQIFGGWEDAIKGVALALGILFGIQTLTAIGSMAMQFVKLIKTMKMMGNAALIAQAKALVIPLLIGAAIVALGLIIEDIVRFFRGEDSVTGIVVQAFKDMWVDVKQGFIDFVDFGKKMITDMFNALSEKFDAFGQTAKVAIAFLLTPIRMLITTLRTAFNIVKAISGGGGIGGVATALKTGFTDLFAPAIQAQSGQDVSLGASLGFGAAPTNNVNNGKTNVVNNLEVKVPPQLTPEEAAVATQNGVKEAMGTLLRETGRQVSTPVAE